MFKLFYLLILVSLYSCASVSADWGPWTMEDSPAPERTWRFCTEELDGPELHNKGYCYQSEECRNKTTILGNDKKECRRLPLFCAHGDMNCLVKYGINTMTISNKK